jgi:hypothetical protein
MRAAWFHPGTNDKRWIAEDPMGKSADRFEQVAQQGSEPGFFREYWEFVKHHRKWWLVPVLLIMGALGLLIVLSSTAAAPFLYTFW